MKTVVPIVLVLLALLPPAVAQDETPEPLTAAVAELFGARGEAAAAAVEKILALEPDPEAVAELLAEGPEYGDPGSPGWRIRSVAYKDGVDRPYHLYVPESYDSAVKAPVLIHMHGGVSRPQLLTEAEMMRGGYRDWWKEPADEWGFLVVFPLGQMGAMWWDEVGVEGLDSILVDVKRDLNVDENKVFATGFSDGASGAFFLGLTRPTFYAGCIPLNGHPGVGSRYSGKQLYVVNQWLRPLYVVSTQEDQLYPSRALLPYIEAYIKSDVQLRYTTYPGIGHQPGYRDEQNPLIAEWMNDTLRDPHPKVLCWQTADLDLGRAAWVTILELGETPGAPEFEDMNPMVPEGRVLLGVNISREFEGVGTRIDTVQEESTAAALGLEPGDVIQGIDDAEIMNLDDLRAALGEKRHGDDVSVKWRRGEEEMSAEGAFPVFVPEPTFARDRPSGRMDVTVEGNRIDIQLAGVRRFALDLSSDMVDFSKKVEVFVNGKLEFRGKVGADLEHLLRSYVRDRDRSMLYLARIELGT